MNEHSDDTDSRLWHYALEVYAQPRVAEACLEAQDVHGIDVNLLLCAAWCARCGRALAQAEVAVLDERCRAWREQVIVPLRRQRRNWRNDARYVPDYAAIKRLELFAEREQLERLEAALDTPHSTQSDRPAVLLENLRAVLAHFQVAGRPSIMGLETDLLLMRRAAGAGTAGV